MLRHSFRLRSVKYPEKDEKKGKTMGHWFLVTVISPFEATSRLFQQYSSVIEKNKSF